MPLCNGTDTGCVAPQGPSFKEQSESWIDAETGKITVRTNEKGKL